MPPSSGYKSELPQQASLKVSKFVPDSMFYSRRQYQFSWWIIRKWKRHQEDYSGTARKKHNDNDDENTYRLIFEMLAAFNFKYSNFSWDTKTWRLKCRNVLHYFLFYVGMKHYHYASKIRTDWRLLEKMYCDKCFDLRFTREGGREGGRERGECFITTLSITKFLYIRWSIIN